MATQQSPQQSLLKTCIHCHEEKPIEMFHRHPEARDGRDPRCKLCVSKRKAERTESAHLNNGRLLSKRYRIPPEFMPALVPAFPLERMTVGESFHVNPAEVKALGKAIADIKEKHPRHDYVYVAERKRCWRVK